MKQYELRVARTSLPGAPPIIVVQIPWADFQHPLGCDEYERQIAKAKHAAMIVSLSPQGNWHCGKTLWAHLWPQILANTPAEELGWHTMQVMGDEAPPWEKIQRWIDSGIR